MIIRHRSAARKGDPSRATPAILLNARRTQTSKAMGLESVCPGEELFLRQLVDLAGLLDGDHTASHCDDDRGLTTYYPSAGVRRWQTFSKQRFDQGITERRLHERHGDGDGPTSHSRDAPVDDRAEKSAAYAPVPCILLTQHARMVNLNHFSRFFHAIWWLSRT